MKLKGTHHIALRTPNFEAMEAFYSQTLGFPVVRRWDERRIIFIDIGSTTIELIGRDEATADNNPSGGWHHVALLVENVEEAYAELVANNVRIQSPPKDLGDVVIAFFYDPDGNVLELFEERR
jgi:catechol 2,3-dioxygenase-like lactoylglutathione lyase family enzyme